MIEPSRHIFSIRVQNAAVSISLACLLSTALIACGGSAGQEMAFATGLEQQAAANNGAREQAAAVSSGPSIDVQQASSNGIGDSSPFVLNVMAALATTNASNTAAPRQPPAAPSAATPVSIPQGVMSDLGFAGTTRAVTASYTGPTANCAETYSPPAALTQALPSPLPANGGVFFTTGELATWRTRIETGPFVSTNDFKPGSPGDWDRILANARTFIAKGESFLITANPDKLRATHGTLARDTAFHYLMTNNAASLAAVRDHLLAQVAHPLNDFSKMCFRALDGSARDAWFGEAGWLLRHIVAYDFVRSALPEADRTTIENWVRRNAYFFAAQIDWGNAFIFPKRLVGDYRARAGAAAATTDAAIFASQRVDSNGDCKIDGADDPKEHATYAYTRADGSNGPRISYVSQWFNNRKSTNALAYGAAGLLLGDAELINRSKRYTMEWLTYAVWPDGSEGEYFRNGEYCIPKQGVIYAAANIQGSLLMGGLLARQGDMSLFNFRTTAGLHGTQAGPGQAAKSLESVVSTHFKLATRQLPWHFHEGTKRVQAPREDSHLGRMESFFMGKSPVTDNFHELGMLLAAPYIGAVPIAGLVMRDPAVTSLRFPGSTGNAAASGFGSWAGVWTDAFNALPAVLLLRP